MDAGQQQGRRPRRLGRRAAALGAAAAVAGLATAPTAQAGTYTVDVCREWTSGAVAGVPPTSASGLKAIVNECPIGGKLRAQLHSTSLAGGASAEFGFTIPGSAPNAAITRIQSAYDAAAPSSGTASVQLLASGQVLENIPAPNAWEADEVLETSTREIAWRISCHAGAQCTFPSATGMLEVRKARLTVEESAAPTGAAVDGPLLGTGAQAGTRDLRVTASDADSGVRRVGVRLGGVAAGEVVSSCTSSSWSPCPTELAGVDVPVDTTRVADGTHALSLVVQDAAGNTTTVDAGSVVVDNVPPPLATSGPALSGTPMVGETLVLDPGAWDGQGRAVTLELRWQRSADGTTWVDLAPAAGDPARLVLGAGDVGARVRAVVRASSSEGSTQAVAGPTAAVAGRPAGDSPAGSPGSGPADGGVPGGGTPVPVLVLPGAGATAPVPGAVNSASGQPAARMVISVTDRRRAARVRYGASLPVTGTLRDAGGRPVPGARVEVFEVPAGGGAARAVASVVTDAAGRFSHRPRTGPSRTLRFAYRAHHGDVAFASTQEVALRVVAAVTLRTDRRALRNGQRVTFRGGVRGTSGRKLVELQVRRGSRWMTFATTFTRRGAFSYRYRFVRTRSTARFAFRARVLKDTGFPYETGTSRSARVLVRGAR